MLRELRQQEMLRIAWRDLNALAPVETILHELTDFAEAWLHKRCNIWKNNRPRFLACLQRRW